MTDAIVFYNEYLEIPEATRDALTHFITSGQPTGGFLHAVLCNDLCDAAIRADLEHRKCLALIATWIYHRAPPDCHGSAEVVRKWALHRGLLGRE